MVSSSDTLLKVSTLDIALDIYFRQRLKIAICGSFIGLEVVNYKELWVVFYLRITFSRFSRVLWTMSKTNSICLRLRTWWVCTPRLPRFILVVNFSNTFLVVSILDIRLPFSPALSVSKGLTIVPVGTMDPFLLEDNPFKTVKGLLNYA